MSLRLAWGLLLFLPPCCCHVLALCMLAVFTGGYYRELKPGVGGQGEVDRCRWPHCDCLAWKLLQMALKLLHLNVPFLRNLCEGGVGSVASTPPLSHLCIHVFVQSDLCPLLHTIYLFIFSTEASPTQSENTIHIQPQHFCGFEIGLNKFPKKKRM